MTGDRERAVEEVAGCIEGLMALRMRSYGADEGGHPKDISMPQLHALATLQRSRTITVSEFAQRLHVSTPSASTILDRLEERGYVTRARGLDDRRVVHAEITPAGVGKVAEFAGLRRDHVARITGAMDDRELSDFLAGLRSLTAALARLQTSADPNGCGVRSEDVSI